MYVCMYINIIFIVLKSNFLGALPPGTLPPGYFMKNEGILSVNENTHFKMEHDKSLPRAG